MKMKSLNAKVYKSETKIINFDDVTKEKIKEHIQIDHKFLIIHAEY